MVKYKVRDVANDLGVSSKKITEILEKHCGVSKKTMATLEEKELNIVFDVVTQEKSLNSLDSYFASRNNTADDKKEEVNNEKKDNNKGKKKSEKPAKAEKAEKNDKKQAPAKSEKPAKQQANSTPAPQPANAETEDNTTRKRRVIDTRAINVDVERYNQKYDDLANASSKMRSTDNTVKKQKFTNRSQKQKGRRQGRKETEQERLKRIAMERKQKQMTIEIPEEIVVQELALRLKATVE